MGQAARVGLATATNGHFPSGATRRGGRDDICLFDWQNRARSPGREKRNHGPERPLKIPPPARTELCSSLRTGATLTLQWANRHHDKTAPAGNLSSPNGVTTNGLRPLSAGRPTTLSVFFRTNQFVSLSSHLCF